MQTHSNQTGKSNTHLEPAIAGHTHIKAALGEPTTGSLALPEDATHRMDIRQRFEDDAGNITMMDLEAQSGQVAKTKAPVNPESFKKLMSSVYQHKVETLLIGIGVGLLVANRKRLGGLGKQLLTYI